MNIHSLKLQLLLFSGVAAFVLGSCKDESSVLGLDLYPEGDQPNIEALNLRNIHSYVVTEDSVVAAGTGANLLGILNDPEFGITHASFYAQVRTSSNNIDFGNNPIIDSVVLGLGAVNVFGDSTYAHDVSIYEVVEDISDDSSYYSNVSFQIEPTPLGTYSGSIYVDGSDSISIGGEEMPNHLRLPLDNSFGQRILDQSGLSTLDDPDAFLEYFKGIYVRAESSTPAQGAGNLIAFGLTGNLSKITLYYHTDDQDSLSFDLVISDNSARVNHYEHDFSNTVELQAALNDTASAGKDMFYLKSLGGVRPIILLPNLVDLQEKGALNNAHLVVPVIDNPNEVVDQPTRLSIVQIDSTGKSLFLPDFFDNEVLLGGFYSESKNAYTFNITRHIHQVIQEEVENRPLAFVANGGAILANHVILGGVNHPDPSKRIRLELYFTKP